MNRDYDYYEANAASIRLEEITSSKKNKWTLERLRDGNIDFISFDRYFDFGEDLWDDLGWVGYFIGKSESLQELAIKRLPRRIIDALSDGIARNQSIQHVSLGGLSNDGFATIARALGNLTQLESLTWHSNSLNDCVTLGTLLDSGGCKNLKELSLSNFNEFDDAGVAFAHGLRNIGSSLEKLNLSCNDSIGSEGLTALAGALANSASLGILDFSYNDFSGAAGLASLASLSDWLQTAALDELRLRCCDINNAGLQALSEDAINHCKHLDLTVNSITTPGFRHLSNSLQSGRSRLENLRLSDVGIENDDVAEVFARGLVGNKKLRALILDGHEEDVFSLSPAVWATFSSVLCNTSNVNDTYLSNHTIAQLWEEYHGDYVDEDVQFYLKLNSEHPQYAAKCKILRNHNHLSMVPLLQFGLKCLPLAVRWFERAKPCTTLSFYDRYGPQNRRRILRRILEESDEELESRVLTALYEFVRGVPKKVMERRDQLILVAAYDDKIARLEEENERLHEDVEQRDRKIAQLEEDNKRLRGVVKSARRALDIIEGEE